MADNKKQDLNEQQKRFCEAIPFNNKVQSYMIAYPDCEYKSASASATRLLEDVRVNDYIDELKKDIENITGVSKIRNVLELSKIAYSTIAHLHNSWIELKEFESLTDEQKAAIESIETKTESKIIDKETFTTNHVKIKLHSKISAIDKINVMLGYNEPEKSELSGGITIKTHEGDSEL